MPLSIIIPARNDAAALRRTLECLTAPKGTDDAEIIVAAWGNPEGTQQAVARQARLIWPSGSTRAELMNAGAEVAGGAFEHRFTEAGVSLRLISWINRIRYRLTRNYYGDQGIFVRTALFRRMGGYRHLQLLEDLDFSQRLKRMGRSVLVRTTILTSGRRFLARGPWRTFLFIVWIFLCRTVRLDTERYAARWRGPADRPPGSPWS